MSISCSDAAKVDGVHVLVVPNNDHVLAHYTLNAAQSDVTFENSYILPRKDSWAPQSPDFEFDGLTLSRKDSQAFTQFTLVLQREPQFYDRKYVSIEKIGDAGWTILFIPFRLKNHPTRIQIQPRQNDVVKVGAETITHKNKSFLITERGQRIAYAGPEEFITTRQNFVLIAGDDIPSPLQDLLLNQMTESVTHLSRALDITPKAQSLIFVSSVAGENGRHSKGGVLQNGVVTFRYRGFDLNKIDQSLSDSIINTAAHETAHLWLGNLYKNTRNEEESWAHEGAAEYLADWSRQPRDAIRAEAQDRLNRCIIRLGDKPLDGRDGPIHGQTPYNCGYFINYVADHSVQKTSGKTIADIWKTVFDNAQDFEYAPQDFITAVNEITANHDGDHVFTDIANLFLLPRKQADWKTLPDMMRSFGFTLEMTAPHKQDSRWINSLWLMPLLASYCEGSYGFHSYDADYQLDTRTGCQGALAGSPRVAKVGHIDFIENPYDAFLYVKTICAQKGALNFYQTDETPLEPVICAIDVTDIPPQFTLIEPTNSNEK